MAVTFTIVGIGEALWDLLPQGAALGGATLNAALHAHQLAVRVGGRGVVVSRVGQDGRGDQVVSELEQRGMTTWYLQRDPDRPTGIVYVDVDAGGEPSFDIVRDVAWDWMQYDPDLDDLAHSTDAVCFGSLAQRVGESRSTIYRFLNDARRAIKLFDVNLRQDYYDQRVIRRSCELASIVKMNESELPVVVGLLGMDISAGEDDHDATVRRLMERYHVNHVALTRGERGTLLYTAEGRYEGTVPTYERAEHADSVGAGDACTAGLLYGMVRRWPLERTLELANHLGAYVASQPGAVPVMPDAILRMAE